MVVQLPSEKPGEVVQHDRRHRRQVDKPGIPLEEPGGKALIHLALEHIIPSTYLLRNRSGFFVHEQNQFRPSMGKMGPFRMPCPFGRKSCRQPLNKPLQAARPVRGWIVADADARPGRG